MECQHHYKDCVLVTNHLIRHSRKQYRQLLTSIPDKNGKEKRNKPILQEWGFGNYKWTEIVVDDEEECNEIAREVKRAIIQMSKREEKTPLDSWTDKLIRVNHKTYATVEVLEDRNGRMIYTPLRARQREAGINLGAEIRTPQVFKIKIIRMIPHRGMK